MGTALSAPLVWMVAQALLTWLAWNQRNRRSTWGVIGLALFGAATFIGALGEPITYELLNPVTFNPLLAVIQAGMIIIPFVGSSELSMARAGPVRPLSVCSEHDAQPIMIKIFESVGQTADLFNDQVDGFGAAVGNP
jgi:hypothetical protein